MTTQDHTPSSSHPSAESNTPDSADSSPLPPFLYLEIHRGKTGFPERPVTSKNYLIGSGEGCDLRLGGAEIPAAHSALVIANNQVEALWLADSPPLHINGEPVHNAALQEGDEIQIGSFRFTVNRFHGNLGSGPGDEVNQPSVAPAPPTEEDTALLMSLVSDGTTAEAADDLAELSASELVAQLEADQAAVEEFEAGVRQGEDALLYAAAQRAVDLADETADQIDDSAEDIAAESETTGEEIDADVLEELEKVIRQLSGFSSELDERAQRLAQQESTQSEAANLLLDAQKELANQLERFHQQIADTQPAPGPKLRKAA